MTFPKNPSLPLMEALEDRLMMDGFPGPNLTAVMNDGVIPLTIVPGDSGTMAVNIENIGDQTAQADQMVVRAYLSTDTNVDVGQDILLGEYKAAINLPAGTSGGITMKLTVPVDSAKGDYYLLLDVDATNVIAESDELDNIVVAKNADATDRVRTLAWKFGDFANRTNVTLTLPGPSDNGKNVTFSMTGKGYGEVTSDVAAGPYDVTIASAKVSDKVTISAVASEDAALGTVLISGCSLGTFSAANLALTGDFTAQGALRSLALGDAGSLQSTSDSVIDISGIGDKSTLTATFASVANVHLLSDIPIKSLTALQWQDSVVDRALTPDEVDVLSAPSIAALKITGRTKGGAIAGDFQSDLTTTGAAKTTLTKATIAGDVTGRVWSIAGGLDTLTVGGTVQDSTIRTTGGMNKVTLGAAIGSDFLAGIVTADIRHATAAADFSATPATIGTFKVAGLAGQTGRFFEDSNLSAAKFGTVSLANIELDNSDTPFGIYSLDVPGKTEIKSISASDSETWFSWTWKPKGERDFTLQDFTYHVVPLV